MSAGASPPGQGTVTWTLECTSRVESAVVYARGAVVSRRVTPPPGPLPAGPVDLVVPGVTLLAHPGSFRVYPEGERRALRVSARLTVPPPPGRPAHSAEIAAAGRRLAMAERARRALEDRRAALAAFAPRVVGRAGPPRREAPAARFEDALAAGALVDEVAAELDRRAADLDARLDELRRAHGRAEREAARATAGERQGAAAPSWSVDVRFEGAGALPSFRLEYAVEGARWWPLYAAHVSFAERSLVWHLDALVAQDTGEDWRGVRLALTTADLVHDGRLPALAPLRIGRAPGPVVRGYRLPTAGADRLFAGYDVALHDAASAAAAAAARPSAGGSLEAGTAAPPPVAPVAPFAPFAPFAATAPTPVPPSARATAATLLIAAPPPVPRGTLLPARLPSEAPHDGLVEALSAAPYGGGDGDGPPTSDPSSFDPDDESPTQPGLMAATVPPFHAAEPGPSWLDFDALAVAGPHDRERRGRLTRRDESLRERRAHEASAALARVTPPPFGTDPLAGRGHFDARYDAEAAVDVAADARGHRVHVLRRPAPAAFRFRCVPREDLTVYREAEVTNPFGSALLAGPVDVFLDGALSTTLPVAPTDRGGTLQLGLGAEDRVRVARAARSEERAATALGGPTAVDHTIAIDVRSSLSFPVRLELVERVPVADDRSIESRLVYARPKAEPYDQADRGAPVRGGLRWWLELGPAERARVEYGYYVAVPPKTHLVGGARREP